MRQSLALPSAIVQVNIQAGCFVLLHPHLTAALSHRRCLQSYFFEFNSRMNLSNYPSSLLMSRMSRRICAGIDSCKTTLSTLFERKSTCANQLYRHNECVHRQGRWATSSSCWMSACSDANQLYRHNECVHRQGRRATSSSCWMSACSDTNSAWLAPTVTATCPMYHVI